MEDSKELELTNNEENETTEEVEETNSASEETSDSSQEDVVEEEKISMTQKEFDEKMKIRLERQERSLKRKFEEEMSEYERTRQILSSTFGTDDIKELNQKMIDYYTEEGIEIPEAKPKGLTNEEIEILGNAEAQKIIELGEEEIIEELDRLKDKGADNLTPKEKYVYKNLYETLEKRKELDELEENGIDASILEDSDFKQYEKKFSQDMSLVEKVNLYQQLTQKEPPKKPGSMESTPVTQEKDYYTEEEVVNLSPEEWQKPGVWEKVRASQKKWKINK